ncbi:FecR family protein [Paenibacillus sacheonensis]|uniref:FecR protein domain-containing protein n=1 Tax=Paenibacillus sacheonensis TaxID=742054 RepID=A0A7X4YKE5_9BACL|nr:FecR family protein [Paenibacillus sacheonensis]MBM7563699.1 Spy/CpxP family protein refolding chaperone [Paenibacillus sacheonensis]NBC67945.1 hypothetical protein [Paenibacillus sacheonensis]
MRKRSRRALLTALCFLLVIGPASLFGGKYASAQLLRIAVVQSLKGGVTVLKSGGTKPFKAFKSMSLNEGDQIATGKDGGAVLELSSAGADEDSITIAANSVVNFSKLKDAGGTKTKLSVWAGSLWVKVKSVSNASDQFEVETPTSIMGVRGTQFYVNVNPMTGLTNLFLAAGVVQAGTNGNRLDAAGKKPIDKIQTIYPGQQIAEAHDAAGLKTQVSTVNIDELVEDTTPEILRAILESAKTIKDENDETLEKAKKEIGKTPNKDNFGGQLLSQEDLNRIAQNLNSFVALIAKEAIEKNKIDKSMIDEMNKTAGKPLIDLSIEKQLSLTENEKQQQDLLLQLMKEMQLEAERQNEAVRAAMLEAKKEALLAKQKAEELLEKNMQKAAEELLQAELQFFQALTAAQQQAFNQERLNAGLPPIGATKGTGGTSAPPSGSSAKASLKFANPLLETTPLQNGGPLELNVAFSGMSSSSRIAGYQIEVEYSAEQAAFDQERFADPETSKNYRALAPGFNVEPPGTSVANADSVDDFRVVAGASVSRLIYTVAKFNGDPVAVSDGTVMVKLPFLVHPAQEETSVSVPFHIRSITAVDANGIPIGMAAAEDLIVRVQRVN